MTAPLSTTTMLPVENLIEADDFFTLSKNVPEQKLRSLYPFWKGTLYGYDVGYAAGVLEGKRVPVPSPA